MKRFVILIVIIIAAAVAGYYFLIWDNTETPNQPVTQNPSNTSDWVTYTNHDYDFSLSHPADWEVAEFTEGLVLGINIYKPGTASSTFSQPLIHFDNATFVGIYPDGIGTEGILGQTKNSSVDFGKETAQAVDYVLEDGNPWATFAKFENYPASWNLPNFVWGAVQLSNATTTCKIDGREHPIEDCDFPIPEGAEVVRRATINSADREIVERILGSIQFTEGESNRAPVSIDTPAANAPVTSPLSISGEAFGTWFFEASFPVELQDASGKVIAQGVATAQGEWMTENYVPFDLQLTFNKPTSTTGTIVFRKDNPSGLPENEDAFELPVKFE